MTPIGAWTFANPAWLALLLVLPLLAWLRARRAQPVYVIPFVSEWAGTERVRRSPLASVAVMTALVLFIVALARPQRIDPKELRTQEGYDIVLAVDLSGSMLAEDSERDGQRINRVEALKPVIDAFAARRPNDRIGVVAFGGRAYTLAPLTTDHDWLGQQVGRLHVGLVEDGTAIGDAVALAVARLDQPARNDGGQRQGGFVVLLTDGANNAGAALPADAVSPTRLDRAKLLTEDLLDELHGDRIGLLLFAGTAFVQAPLSADTEVLRSLLPQIDPTYIPQGGTHFAQMLEAAAGAFGGGDAARFLVLLSDGEASMGARGMHWPRRFPESG